MLFFDSKGSTKKDRWNARLRDFAGTQFKFCSTRNILPKGINEICDYEISIARDLNFVRLETFAKKVQQNPAYERAEFIRNKIYPLERHFSRRFSPWTEIFGKKAGLRPNRASPHTDRNTRATSTYSGRRSAVQIMFRVSLTSWVEYSKALSVQLPIMLIRWTPWWLYVTRVTRYFHYNIEF